MSDTQMRMNFYTEFADRILWGTTTLTTGERCGDAILRDLAWRQNGATLLQQHKNFVLRRVVIELKNRAYLDGNEASDIALDDLVTRYLTKNHSLPRGACVKTLQALCRQ